MVNGASTPAARPLAVQPILPPERKRAADTPALPPLSHVTRSPAAGETGRPLQFPQGYATGLQSSGTIANQQGWLGNMKMASWGSFFCRFSR